MQSIVNCISGSNLSPAVWRQ